MDDNPSNDKKRLNLSRRKALVGLGAVGAAGAGAGFGTTALFSDQESFTNNSITAGTLNLSVTAEIVEANQYWADEGILDGASATADGDPVVGLQVNDVKPGDWAIICFDITVEDNPGYVQISTADFAQYENGQTEPEIDAEGDDGDDSGSLGPPVDGRGLGELQDELVAEVYGTYDEVDSDAPRDYLSDEDPSLSGSAATTFGEFATGVVLGGSSDPTEVEAGETVTEYLLLELPTDVGNEIQSDAIEFDLVFRTEQARNNDEPFSDKSLSLLGRYASGLYDEGGAEIASYDPGTERVFVINADAGQADVLDVSDPTNPEKVGGIDPSADLSGFTVGSVNSVDTQHGTVALAVEADDLGDDGRVAFYNANDSSFLGSAPLGPLPDLVKFVPDGNTVLVANEGEPSDDYGTDPEGSVSVVDVSGGFGSASSTNAGFSGFNATSLRSKGVRIFGPGASAAEDLEPESVVASPDSQTAYVSLQENNAIAIMDISDTSNPTVDEVVPLGYKDFSVPGNELDAVDDGTIDIRTEPLFGMYQPDVLETAEIDGETYLVTASEGDAREYDALFETGILTDTGGGDFKLVIDDEDISGGSDTADVDVDESAFSDGVLSRLEGLEVTARPPSFGSGDVSNPGPVSELYLFGGRSYMILDSGGNIVFESGSQLERIVRDSDDVPDDQFNTDNNENGIDEESAASGPEPEGVAVGQVGDQTCAFIGLEEVGGIAAFDISSPGAPGFVDYINTRNFDVAPEDEIEDGNLSASAAGDLGPEGIEFVSAADSPIDDAMLVVGHEVSGTTAIYRVE